MNWKTLVGLLAVSLASSGSCAKVGPDPTAREWRSRLANAMQAKVATREQRDENSKVLVEAVEHDAVQGLNLAEVQAAFGQGQPCSTQSLCAEQGFAGDDLYFPIGERADDAIKQLPALIIGFDPHGGVKRVYTLKTH